VGVLKVNQENVDKECTGEIREADLVVDPVPCTNRRRCPWGQRRNFPPYIMICDKSHKKLHRHWQLQVLYDTNMDTTGLREKQYL
jgi:predicted metal-binding protein